MNEPREFPDRPLDGTTELRIHGVSGTPVTSMLDDPHPQQVWGDATAGFYRRPADGNDGTDHLEAYSWGGLTAGSSVRAAWLLLLPFTLVNVASWAHPARRGDRSHAVGTMSGALRVLALTLTLTLVLATAILTMDVLAWQCGGIEQCAQPHWYTRWLLEREPATRVVWGAVPVLALIGAMWRLSRSTTERYERQPDTDERTCVTDAPTGAVDMSNRAFWLGRGPVTRLRAMHLGAALAFLAGLVAYAARSVDEGASRATGLALTVTAATLVATLAAVLATPLAGRRRDLFEGRPPHHAFCKAVLSAPRVAGLLLAAAAAYAFSVPFDAAQPDNALPGAQGAKNLLVAVQVAALAVLFFANAVAHRERDRTQPDAAHPPLLRGMLATFLAILGVAIAAAFAAGLTFRVADYLGCPDKCANGGVDFDLPVSYLTAARSFAFIVVPAAVLAAGYYFTVAKPRARRAALANVETEYAGYDDPDRSAAIARAQAGAALTDVAAGPFALVVLVGIALGVAASLLHHPIAQRLSEQPGTRLTGFESALDFTTRYATGAGTWLAGAFAIGLLLLGRLAYRNPSMRRTVGIVWDLGTFWPRAVHPFAPPCYCERTIPEFTRRIEQVTDAGGRVVVSAHSQGTVIAFAALLQLSDRRDRLALLTYGSPLHRLYARAFPHFFGLPVLRWGRDMLGDRWVNLYRRSDPIGGPVTCADRDVPADAIRPDRRLRDPAFAVPDYAFDYPLTRGHSHYPHDPAFAASVRTLATELGGDAAPPVVPAQALAKGVRAR
ncbi:MAG TPA: hypothetical protein VNA20_06095 [Frankiaceae bacterium]|nr:hypothetical protein [Frankiaceae bacterium]